MELHVTQYRLADGVATITLHRPGRGNSWTSRMNAEYRWLMRQADQDPEARVIVVRGSGRQFCVGADTKALDHYTETGQDYVKSHAALELEQPGYGVRPEFDHELVWQWGLQKPVIAAVNGACAGIAVALAGFCDMRYAVAGAKFTTATPRLGLPAEYGLSWLLPRLAGITHAADILLSGRVFTAEEALDMGLLNAVFDADEFDRKIGEIAGNIARTVSPAAARAAKRQLYQDVLRFDVGQSIEDSKALIGEMIRGADYLEGVRAMKDKRPPSFPPLSGGPG